MNDDRNPSDDETDPIEAKEESTLCDRKLLYQELDSLIIEACQHHPDSFTRRRYLSQIMIKMRNSGLIWHLRKNEPLYEDAVQEQWCFFSSNLCEPEPHQSPQITSMYLVKFNELLIFGWGRAGFYDPSLGVIYFGEPAPTVL